MQKFHAKGGPWKEAWKHLAQDPEQLETELEAISKTWMSEVHTSLKQKLDSKQLIPKAGPAPLQVCATGSGSQETVQADTLTAAMPIITPGDDPTGEPGSDTED